MIKTSCNPSLIICFQSGRIVLNLSRLLENHPDILKPYGLCWGTPDYKETVQTVLELVIIITKTFWCANKFRVEMLMGLCYMSCPHTFSLFRIVESFQRWTPLLIIVCWRNYDKPGLNRLSIFSGNPAFWYWGWIHLLWSEHTFWWQAQVTTR